MINKYLDKLDTNYKNNIIKKINNDNDINLFINNCCKLNLDIFEKKNNEFIIIDKDILKDKISSLQEIYIKTFGMKIFKKYSQNTENCIDNIERNFDKLKEKIIIINILIEFLKNYTKDDFMNLFMNSNKLKINYSQDVKSIEIIDFDSGLFITSDDIDYDSDRSNITNLLYPMNFNEKFIDEYSN